MPQVLRQRDKMALDPIFVCVFAPRGGQGASSLWWGRSGSQ
jgi:hypothetical protein